ncbi:MAG: ZIP family metal transporter [Polyangiaceae bacterium]|nr:ZIP family metal transporter [Polyangiaceae bacterium]
MSEPLSPLAAGLLGSLVAGLGTGLGAAPIFARATWSASARRMLLAAAGGMMLGATFFSLLRPALELARTRVGSGLGAAGLVAAGMLLGGVALWGLHGLVPHEHFTKGREGARAALGRYWMVVLAIALHNLPEGLSVGVAYGEGAGGAGHAVTLGILAQNLPEGLAVAAALVADGASRTRAFVVALLTGLVEPLGGLLGALAVSVSAALLPWGLAFAAGAMLFVVSGEVLPETHVEGEERSATFAITAGFIVMMLVAEALG